MQRDWPWITIMAALQIQLDDEEQWGMLRSWGLGEPRIPALWLLIWDSKLACVITGDPKSHWIRKSFIGLQSAFRFLCYPQTFVL